MWKEANDWSSLRGLAPWYIVEIVLPGTALVALVLWLSWRFVREGFADVRAHPFAAQPRGTLHAPAVRNWWSCTCGSLAACRCIAAVGRAVRRCCMKVIPLGSQRVRAAA